MLNRIALIAALAVACSTAGASSALIAEARTLASQSPTRAGETRLREIVLELGAGDSTQAARQLLEQLADMPPRLMVRHEEGNARVPYADVGAAARYALHNWTRNDARASAQRTGRSGDMRLLESYFSADAVAQKGIIDAIGGIPRTDLQQLRDVLGNRVVEPGGDALGAAFAAALHDPGLYRQVLKVASIPVALQVMPRLRKDFDASTALRALRPVLLRPELASAALFEIGQLRTELPAAEQIVWKMLSDPQLGGTAAAVLARDATRVTVDQLLEMLQGSDDKLLQKRALLALRLSKDPRGLNRANEWLEQQQ